MTRSSLLQSLAPSTAAKRPMTASPRHGFDAWLGEPSERTLQHDALIVAAEVADALPIDDRESREDAATLLAGMLALAHSGVSRLELTPVDAAVELLARALKDVIGLDTEVRRSMASRALERLIRGEWPALLSHEETSQGESVTPLVRDGQAIAVQRFYAGERRVARRLPTAGTTPHPETGKVLAQLAQSPARLADGAEILLNDEQEDAVRRIISNRFLALSGGPGTGKTTVVVAMLRALVRTGVEPEDIQLAAPTGRAAWRMVESIRSQLASLSDAPEEDRRLRDGLRDAKTIHRLLGYSPRRGRFSRHRNHPLPARVVIVDESSMIPLSLMLPLFDALAPETRLVLIGDPHQLPPVEAGAVFADIVEAVHQRPSLGLSVELKESFRMKGEGGGSEILLASRALIANDWDGLADHLVERASSTEVVFEGVEWINDDSLTAYRAVVDALWARLAARVPRWPTLEGVGPLRDGVAPGDDVDGAASGMSDAECRSLFDSVQRGKVLCLTRGGRFGVHAINRHMQRQLAGALGASPGVDRYLPGQPVMVTQNDYEREIFNGDIGIVVPERASSSEEYLSVWLPRAAGGVRFPVDEVDGVLESAFALTVHKSQGSEFDEVALVLPDDPDLPLLSRNMIYTAMTRARHSVVLFGSEKSLRAGMERTPQRQSNFARFLE